MASARVLLAILLAATSSLASHAASPEPPAGAASCTGCHPASAKIDTAIPRIHGRNATDIAAQMQAFKAGQRPGTVMDRIAKGFSEQEMQAIATWFASQR